MFWLASCFSKIKKPNSHFLENQRGIAGVRKYDDEDEKPELFVYFVQGGCGQVLDNAHGTSELLVDWW